MLPSSGYFRNILCPFFVSGFCERPHCHFKHEKRGIGLSYASSSLPIVQQNSEDHSITSSIGQKTDLLQYYSDAIKKLQEELQAGTTLLVNKEPNDVPDQTVTYIPTPVNKPKTDTSLSNGLLAREDSPESSFSFYKPTPISKLNKLKSKSENEEYVPVRIKSKSSRLKRRNHEEYDPTKVVPSAKKLKTIDPSSSSDNEMCIDMSNNDGAFSDEESQESLVNNNKFTAYSSSSSSVTTSKNEKTSNIEPETKCNDKYDVLNKILIDCKRTERLGKTGLDHEKIDRAVEMCKKAKESLLSSEKVLTKSNDSKGTICESSSKSNDTEESIVEKKTLNHESGGTSEKKCANHKNSKNLGKTISKSDKSHSKSNKSSSNNSSRSHKRSKEKDHKNNSDKSHKKTSEKDCKKNSYKDDKNNSEKDDKKNCGNENGKNSEKGDKKISENDNPKSCEEVKKSSEKEAMICSEKDDKKCSDKEDKKCSDKEDKKSSDKEDKKSSEKEDKKNSEKEEKKNSEKEDKKSSEKEDKKSSEKEEKRRSEKDDKKRYEKEVKKGSKEVKKGSKEVKKSSEKEDKKSSEKEDKKSSEKKNSSSSKSEKHSSKSKSGSKSIKSKSSESGSKSDKSESHKRSSKSENHSENRDSKSKSKVTNSGTEVNDQKENRKKCPNKSSSSNSTSDKSKSKYSSKTPNDKKESNKHSSSHSKSKSKTSSSSDKLDSEKPHGNRDNCSTNNASDKLNDESALLGFNTSLSNSLFKNIEEKMEMDKLMEEYGSELDEHDTEEECWRIFNEEKALEAQDKITKETLFEIPKAEKHGSKESNLNSSLTNPLFGKKRQAHQPTFAREMKPPKKEIQSPAEVLQSRYERLQQMYLKSHPVEKPLSPPSFVNPLLAINKRRVAHVPNAALIAAASLRVAGKFSPSNHLKNNVTVIPEPTIAVTNPKGTKRVAHVPSESVLARPKIPVQPGSKVPYNTRQRYLDKFIEECLKCCSTAEDAYKKAFEEENMVFQNSSNKNVYLNKAVNTILKLRLESTRNDQLDKGSSSKYGALAQKQTVSHEAMLGGAKAAKTTYSIVKKEKHTSVISGLILYKLLTEYLLTQEQLEENGYPIPNPDAPGKAIFKKLEVTKRGNLHNPLEKTCCRCQKWYRVDTHGNYVTKSSCSYHWGRLYKRKVSGSWQSRYSCCDGDHESIACSEGDGHVHDEYDPDKITGFMQTFSKPPPDDGNYGVYALDCEMCYTTQGTELTRITVIGEDLKPVYETFVKPDTKVLDYNTRFSGITEDDLKNVSTTIRDVQAVLLSMFSDKTILIGHSLESDFRALRLIHNTVVDTAIVFPHKNGPPFKRALRNLVADYLKKIIQNSVDGHDSQEDAASCMELMLWKIKQDMYKRR